MTTDETRNDETPPAQAPLGPYSEAIEEYLAAAVWLIAADAPFKVHARSVARSLDQQLAKAGEIQSALASSFDKVMIRLEARRPPAPPTPTDPAGDSPDGTRSIFTVLD